MRFHNHLPVLLECLARWERPPGVREFTRDYYLPLREQIGVVFDDATDDEGSGRSQAAAAASFHSAIEDLDWPAYRGQALGLDPVREEERARRCLGQVEGLLGLPLEGEVVLWGAFGLLDGYARFDRGTHRVFLGLDDFPEPGADGSRESPREAYLDILITHELTHVARESRPEVWAGFGPASGLELGMTHDEFTGRLPVIEHLLGEGYSCVVSELLNPGHDPWHYCYQTREGLGLVLARGASVDAGIRRQLAAPDGGDYGQLYSSGSYPSSPGDSDGDGGRLPVFSHYVWAWQWAGQLLRERAGGDPRRLLRLSSAGLGESALGFCLKGIRAL